MILPPNKRYSIKSAEDIIQELEHLAEVADIDLKRSDIIAKYIQDIRSILTDPYSSEQLEALNTLTKGMYSLVNDNDRPIIGFSNTIIEHAQLAVRSLEVHTEEVIVSFPEKHIERYLQLYRALEAIRQPDSHEEFHISYNNKDGSTLRIYTSDGSIKWTTIDNNVFFKSNLNSEKICQHLRLFINGNYKFLQNGCKWDNQE